MQGYLEFSDFYGKLDVRAESLSSFFKFCTIEKGCVKNKISFMFKGGAYYLLSQDDPEYIEYKNLQDPEFQKNLIQVPGYVYKNSSSEFIYFGKIVNPHNGKKEHLYFSFPWGVNSLDDLKEEFLKSNHNLDCEHPNYHLYFSFHSSFKKVTKEIGSIDLKLFNNFTIYKEIEQDKSRPKTVKTHWHSCIEYPLIFKKRVVYKNDEAGVTTKEI